MTIKEEAQELLRYAEAIDTNGIAYDGDLASLVVDPDTGQPFHPPLLLGTVRGSGWLLFLADPNYTVGTTLIDAEVFDVYEAAVKEAWRKGLVEKVKWMAAAQFLMRTERRWANLPGRHTVELAVATLDELGVSVTGSPLTETEKRSPTGGSKQSSSSAGGLKDDRAFRSAMEASHAASMSILKGTYIPPRP